MAVGVSVFELHVPQARSLKDKRRVIKAIVDRLHRRFRVSVAETGLHDLHQRSEISLAAVARSDGELDRLMEELRRMIEESSEAVLTHWSPSVVEPFGIEGFEDWGDET